MLSKRIAKIDEYRCVACGTCIHVCPKEALSVWKGSYAKVNTDVCVGCGRCAKACPAGCILVKERNA